MPMLYKKIILQSPDGLTFIRHIKNHFRLLAQVISDESKVQLYHDINDLINQVTDEIPNPLFEVFSFDEQWYAIVLIEADNLLNIPFNDYERLLQSDLKRLVAWFINTHLKTPEANGNHF